MAFVAAMALLFAVAGSAIADPTSNQLCSDCHSGAGPAPAVTLASDTGTTATYNVEQVASVWAAFDGITKVGGGSGTTGSFPAASGHTVTILAVSGFPGPIGTTTIGAPPVSNFTITATAGLGGTISPGRRPDGRLRRRRDVHRHG